MAACGVHWRWALGAICVISLMQLTLSHGYHQSQTPPRECERLEGYTLLPDMDILGYNLSETITIRRKAWSECTLNPQCLAFSSNGGAILKSRITPAVAAPNRCLYIKKGNFMDSQGCGALVEAYGIIPTVTWGDAEPYPQVKSLFANASCDFKLCTYYQDKYGVVNSSNWGALPLSEQQAWTAIGCDTIVTKCSIVPGYIATPDYDHNGSDFGNWAPIEDAIAKCTRSPDCVAFNANGWVKYRGFPIYWLGPDVSCMYYKKYDYKFPPAPPSPPSPPMGPPATPPEDYAPPSPPTDCGRVPGYVALPDVDCPGHDIENRWTESLNEAAAQCSNSTNCVSFNIQGWLKHRYTPLVPRQGFCLWVKEERYNSTPEPPVMPPSPPLAGCENFLGYIGFLDQDHPGDDIRNVGRNPAEVCAALPECKGFNSHGWIKYAVDPIQPSEGICVYIKSEYVQPPPPPSPPTPPSQPPRPPSPDDYDYDYEYDYDYDYEVYDDYDYTERGQNCTVYEGYMAYPDVDHWGNDIAVNPVSDPFAACNEAPTCRAFNTGGYVKYTYGSTYSKPGWCLYVKDATANITCPPVSGYTSVPDVDHMGDDLVAAVLDPALACDLAPSCLGFNSAGYYKSNMTVTGASEGSCLYYKISALPPKTFSCKPGIALWGINLPQTPVKLSNRASTSANTAECQRLCAESPVCKGYYYKTTTWCYLLSEVKSWGKKYNTAVQACKAH